jgi:hypothetical protein
VQQNFTEVDSAARESLAQHRGIFGVDVAIGDEPPALALAQSLTLDYQRTAPRVAAALSRKA